MKTNVVVMQTDGDKTNVLIYGAKSIKELQNSVIEAFNIENVKIYYIEDIDVLAKALTA